jgi:hypothetical protein
MSGIFMKFGRNSEEKSFRGCDMIGRMFKKQRELSIRNWLGRQSKNSWLPSFPGNNRATEDSETKSSSVEAAEARLKEGFDDFPYFICTHMAFLVRLINK